MKNQNQNPAYNGRKQETAPMTEPEYFRAIGRLEAQVQTLTTSISELKTKVEGMDSKLADIDRMANRWKGGFAVVLALGAIFGALLEQIISRWAPPVENNTNAYVQAVVADAALDADQILDMHRFEHLKPLVAAIIHHENGQQPYSDTQLTKGLVLAGVEPEKPSLQKTRTVKGGQAATAATAGLGVVEAIQQTIDPARDALVGLAPYLEVAKWLLLAVTLIGIGVMLWARIDDHHKGLR